MSTVNVDLYALWLEQRRFITSLANSSTPSLPAIVAGDTWNINAYFVDDTTPPRIHRFAGAEVRARIRAAGNNHLYADAASPTEIPSSTVPIVARVRAGTSTLTEKQSITFPSLPIGGTFRIVFYGAGSGGRGGGISLGDPSPYQISTAPIAYNASADDLRYAINGLLRGFYMGNDGPYTFNDLFDRYGLNRSRPAQFTGSIAAGFVIEFGDIYAGANWWNTGINLITIDDSDLQYQWGRTISLPFTASDFSDYLTHGPSYFELLLDGNLAASKQIAAEPGGATAPSFTNGPPPSSGSVGSVFDFSYAAAGFPAPTFSLTSGALPDGLSLTSAGHLSGTPTGAGTFTGVVTATNSAGTATQAFTITINGTGGVWVPPSVPPGAGAQVLRSYRNGNFDVLDYSDRPYIEDLDDEWPGLIIWHIPYCIDIDQYQATKPGKGTLDAAFGYFWKDTPFKYLGDGIVEFERLRHNIPPDANRVISVSKNYQFGDFDVQAGHVLDQAIVGYSQDIKAICNYHFALDDPGDLPVVPFIQMIPYLRQQAMWDFNTGFPKATVAGVAGLYTDNKAASWLPGGSIVPVVGRLVCRKKLFG